MKVVQGSTTVENTSLKSARTILSTVVNDYTGYQDLLSSNEASEKISEKKLPSTGILYTKGSQEMGSCCQ